MLQRILEFWKHGYQTDPVASFYEFVSFVFTVGASLTLALTADAPDMRLIYPAFFIGSVTGVIGYYRRKLAWPLLLVAYFVLVNAFGFGVAMGWW